MTTLGAPFASGRDSDVYAVGHEQVLRRSRSGSDARREAAIMRYVRQAGFPAPRVDDASDHDLTMELVRGPTLLQSLVAGETSMFRGAQVLVELHAALHAIPLPAPGTAAATALLSGPPVESADERGQTVDRILHLDLHPANVVMTTAGPVLLDWTNARSGPAVLDIALTAIVIAEVAVDVPDDTREDARDENGEGAPDDTDYATGARALLSAFISLSDVDLLPILDAAAVQRAKDPGLDPGETGLLPAARDLVASEAAHRHHG